MTPTGNITITSVAVVDANDNPISSVKVGQWVYIRALFTTQDLPAGASYRGSFTVNGLTLNTGPITWGAGLAGAGSWNMYWGTFLATPGINRVTASIDPDQSVPETSYADNTLSTTFNAGLPAAGSFMSYTAGQIRDAYGINSIPDFGSARADGSGQAVALVEAGNEPTILSDLDGFDQAMHLSTQTSQSLYQAYGPAASFATVYNQYGVNITQDIGTSGVNGVPAKDPTGHWEGEETLDVEWAHAIAPGAKIVIIEVNVDANWPTNLLAGDKLAAGLPGVSAISNSWGLTEWSGETAYDASTFVTPSGHTGVTFLTASNDNGANVYPGGSPPPSAGNDGYYPATSPYVVSVGGTELTLSNDGYGSETAWSFPAPATTVGPGDSTFAQTGSWTTKTGGFNGSYRTAAGGSTSTAAWTLAVTPANTGWGTELSATWTANPGNATNATYTVYDGTQAAGTILGRVVVDQTRAPAGTADGGFQFEELGVFFPTLSANGNGMLTVVLNASAANGTVVADAVGSAQAWASTGGPTRFESEPSYQLPFQSTGHRTGPDVSFDASQNSGVTTFFNGALGYGAFGTSLSSPCWAGLIAIANQGRVAHGGTPLNSVTDPTQTLEALYSLPATDYIDITAGYNGFAAGPGYDLVTGRGSPIANLLIADLANYELLSPPAAATQAASSITTTGATLNGSVNPEGSATTVSFVYGTDPTLSTGTTTTAGQAIGSGTSVVAVTAPLTGLQPGTTYYFRITATSAGGSASGAILSFTTLAPPVANTQPATAVSTSGATLNGSVNPEGSATSIAFVYGTDPTLSSGTTTTASQAIGNGTSAVAVSAPLAGLQSGTTYYFRVAAASAAGTTNGAILSFATVTPPVVTTQAASSVTSSGATLNGSVNPEGSATIVSFVYGTDPTLSSGTSTTTAQAIGSGTSAVAVSAPLTGLQAGTTYYFRAAAAGPAGTINGTILSFTTPAPPTAATQPATAIAADGATLNGSVNPGGSDTTVSFVYGTDPTLTTGTTTTASQAVGSGMSAVAVSAPLTGLAPGTSYYFRVVATNAGGTTNGAILKFTTLAPPLATTLAASFITSSGATLNGSANPGGNPTTVAFVYGTDPALSTGTTTTASQAVGAGTGEVAINAVLSGLQPNTTYYARLVATSAGGTTRGAIVSFTTLAPSTATTQAATAVTSSRATLNGSVNPEGSATTVAFVYGTDPGLAAGTTTTAAQAIGSGTSAVAVSAPLTGLQPGTTYYFRIEATNASATLDGAILSFATLAPPVVATQAASSITTTAAILNGSVNPAGSATTASFIYGTDPALTTGTISTVIQSLGAGTSAVALTAPVAGLEPGTAYYVRVTATSAGGTSNGAIVSFTTLAPPAVTTQPATAIASGSATLDGSVNPEGSDTTVSFVYGTDPTLSTGTTTTTAQAIGSGTSAVAITAPLTGLQPGTIYYVRVTATSAAGTNNGAILSFATLTPPVAATQAASSITTTGATLNGSVNPEGSDTAISFVYGTDPTLSSGTTTTTGQGIGNGMSAVAVNAPLSGLQAGTTYYFCVVATSAGGTASGAILSFEAAPGIPGAPVLNSPSIQGDSSQGRITRYNGSVNAPLAITVGGVSPPDASVQLYTVPAVGSPVPLGGLVAATDGTASFMFDVDPALLADGTYRLAATASVAGGAPSPLSDTTTVTVQTSLRVTSITPGGDFYNDTDHPLPAGGVVTITLNHWLAGITTDPATGDAAPPFCVMLIPAGPDGMTTEHQTGVFWAGTSGYDSGDLPLPATLKYAQNADGTAAVTLTPRQPLSTDVYLITVGGLTDLVGNPLADAAGRVGNVYSSFDYRPANGTPPAVNAITTAHGTIALANQAAVPLAQLDAIGVGFNRAMDTYTINSSTIQLFAQGAGTPLPAVVTYSPATRSAYLVPEARLFAGTTYVLKVSAAITDDEGFPKPGYPLGRETDLAFSVTGALPTAQAPLRVTSTTPAAGINWTPPLGYATVTFSEPLALDPAHVGRFSAMLVPHTGGVTTGASGYADVPYNAKLAFNPNTNQLVMVFTGVPAQAPAGVLQVFALSGMRASNGDALQADPGTALPVYRNFEISSVATAAVTRPSRADALVSVPPSRVASPAPARRAAPLHDAAARRARIRPAQDHPAGPFGVWRRR